MMKVLLLIVVSVVLGASVGLGLTWSELGGMANDFSPWLVEHRPANADPAAEEAKIARVLVLNGEEFNFGTMERHAKRSHAFQFKNAGNAPLSLEVGESTCKCTVGKLEDSTIAPGEVVEVKLEWNAIGDHLDFSQSAEIRTNDPSRPVIKLKIRGLITNSVMVEPTALNLGNLSVETEATANIRVLGFRDEELKILSSQVISGRNSDFFELSVSPSTPTDEERKKYPAVLTAADVDLHVKSGLPVGPINQTIRLTVDVPGTDEIEISVTGTVSGDVSVIGPSEYISRLNTLNWGIVRQGEGTEATLQVLVKGELRDNVEVSVASVDPDGIIEASLGEPVVRGKMRMFPLKLSIPPGKPAVNRLGSESARPGRVVIGTTHPQTKELIIHVAFAIEG